jgi:ArsR family transcriptional regulator
MDIPPLPQIASPDIWQDRAALLTVMAHPVRLSILESLCQRPLCVKEINTLVPLAQAQLSQHMAALRKAQLVACHACGTMRCYYILRPTLVKRLIPLLRREHPRQPRDHDAVIRAAKRGRQLAADREQSSTPG